jgi:hypothetical protein
MKSLLSEKEETTMEVDEVNARYQASRRRQQRSINFWFGLAALAGLIATTAIFCWLLAQGVFVLQALVFMGVCALALVTAIWGWVRAERVIDGFEPFRHDS